MGERIGMEKFLRRQSQPQPYDHHQVSNYNHETYGSHNARSFADLGSPSNFVQERQFGFQVQGFELLLVIVLSVLGSFLMFIGAGIGLIESAPVTNIPAPQTPAIPVNYCSPDPCRNEGTCSSQTIGFTCTCPSPFSGPTCEKRPSSCLAEYCPAGICTPNPEGFICSTFGTVTGVANSLICSGQTDSPPFMSLTWNGNEVDLDLETFGIIRDSGESCSGDAGTNVACTMDDLLYPQDEKANFGPEVLYFRQSTSLNYVIAVDVNDKFILSDAVLEVRLPGNAATFYKINNPYPQPGDIEGFEPDADIFWVVGCYNSMSKEFVTINKYVGTKENIERFCQPFPTTSLAIDSSGSSSRSFCNKNFMILTWNDQVKNLDLEAIEFLPSDRTKFEYVFQGEVANLKASAAEIYWDQSEGFGPEFLTWEPLNTISMDYEIYVQIVSADANVNTDAQIEFIRTGQDPITIKIQPSVTLPGTYEEYWWRVACYNPVENLLIPLDTYTIDEPLAENSPCPDLFAIARAG